MLFRCGYILMLIETCPHEKGYFAIIECCQMNILLKWQPCIYVSTYQIYSTETPLPGAGSYFVYNVDEIYSILIN
jgi:hypothetical protein